LQHTSTATGWKSLGKLLERHRRAEEKFLQRNDGGILGSKHFVYRAEDVVAGGEIVCRNTEIVQVSKLVCSQSPESIGNLPYFSAQQGLALDANGMAKVALPQALYICNEGNVFTEAFEAIHSESELQPWTDHSE
jgi:hypothetical protein